MDVNLLVVIITSILVITIFILMLFHVDFSQISNYIFFKNEKYHKFTYFVVLGTILFLIMLVIFSSQRNVYLQHILAISTLLIVFRKGVADK